MKSYIGNLSYSLTKMVLSLSHLLILPLVLVNLAISTPARADVHFVHNRNSDRVVHPKDETKYVTFKLQRVVVQGGELLYVHKMCQLMLQPCEVYGPITEEQIQNYFSKINFDSGEMLKTFDQVDAIHNEQAGVDKGAAQIGIIVSSILLPPSSFFYLGKGLQQDHLLRDFQKIDPLALVYYSEGRDVYFFKNKDQDQLELGAGIKRVIEQIISGSF
jgi:hypothetical protein